MQCIIMENTLIKLTLHDETKKRAHDSQIVRAKENLKLSHGGSSYRYVLVGYGDNCDMYDLCSNLVFIVLYILLDDLFMRTILG